MFQSRKELFLDAKIHFVAITNFASVKKGSLYPAAAYKNICFPT